MARPSVKTRCGGKWTEAYHTNFIKNLLRAGSMKWSPIQECTRRARVRRGVYKCECCGEEVPATIAHPNTGKRTKNIVIDHIIPVISVEDGFTTWDDFIEGLFCELDNLQAICYSCHKTKCDEERTKSVEYRSLRKDENPEYNSWKSMRARCLHEHHHAYPRYGGRGISICPQWDDFFKFRDDMGPRPEGTTLDRVNNDGNYEPNNCRWSTYKEQSLNKSNNLLLDLEGDVRTLSEWSEFTGIPASTIRNRINWGDEVEEALNPDRVRGVKKSNMPIEVVSDMRAKGMSNKDIAEQLGYHEDTIRKVVYKIRQQEKLNDKE